MTSPLSDQSASVWRQIQVGGSTDELLRQMYADGRITLAEYEAEVDRRLARAFDEDRDAPCICGLLDHVARCPRHGTRAGEPDKPAPGREDQ